LVRLGQNFLADPNLLDAIVRDAALAPEDVVLEVGAGEAVLTERLAAVAAHVHTIEIDRGLEPALAGVAALANVNLHWGDAMKLDLAGFEPAPTAMVANLPYSVATPLILRTIELLPSLRRWTVMVQREIADRLRAAERGRPARLRGRAGPQGRPRRLQAAAAGRFGDPQPAPDGSGRRPGDACADPRRFRPPPQVPRPLARARREGLAGPGPGGARGAWPGCGLACRGALSRAVRRPVREAAG
jgi:hypothetical protein